MPRKFGNYSQIFQRFEQEFDIEELTSENIKEFLGKPTIGREGLAEQVSQANLLYFEVDSISDVSTLKKMKIDAHRLLIKRNEVLQKIDERIESLEIEKREREIARGIARVVKFATRKKINLSEKAIGREENWKGRKVFTIRNEKGRFKTWGKAE